MNNSVEYQMSAEMAKGLLKTRKGEELKQQPQIFLCNYVNTEIGVKGICTRVVY